MNIFKILELEVTERNKNKLITVHVWQEEMVRKERN